MAINLKDLKAFPGNKDLGGDFMLLPVDTRKYKVKDIPKLQPNRVQVRAIIPQSIGRPLRPFLCLVSDLPDDDQKLEILKMRKKKRLELASGGKAAVTGGERLVSNLINDYILSDKISRKKDAWTIQQILKFWSKEIGHIEDAEKETPGVGEQR